MRARRIGAESQRLRFAKKNDLTADELFGYRLASLLKVWHPDYLLDYLTAEQWKGWQQFYKQDPWGGQRSDMRMLAHWIANKGEGASVNLTFPYFDDPAELYHQHKANEERAQDPALMAKLKAAREKHRQENARGA